MPTFGKEDTSVQILWPDQTKFNSFLFNFEPKVSRRSSYQGIRSNEFLKFFVIVNLKI